MVNRTPIKILIYKLIKCIHMEVTISARVDRKFADELERLAKTKGVDKSTAIRELLKIGLREIKLKDTLELLREGKITVWKAAEMLEMAYREVLEEMKKHNIMFPISQEELINELKEISSE